MKISFMINPVFRLFSFDKYWSGKLIYITLIGFTTIFDIRKNWIKDMTTGKVS